MNGGFVPLILLVLFGIPSCVVSQQTQLETCSQPFRCGDLEDIPYPFYGGDRPVWCGAEGYVMSCRDNVPLLNTSSLLYRVLEINDQTRTLRVARNDLWSDLCPQQGQQLPNTSIDTNLFSFDQPSNDQTITLLYGCNVPPPTRLSNQFNCGGSAALYFVRTEQISAISCDGLRVTARVTQSAASSLESNLNPDLSTSLLQTSLQGGFSIQWALNNQNCQRCLGSGGACGSNASSGSFLCYCANNASFPLTCPDGNNSFSASFISQPHHWF